MNFNDVIKKIEENKKNHEQGYYNCIPFMGMKRLESFLPGVEQACYYLIGASSGVGKSKITRFLFLHNPIMYVENVTNDIKLDILYFSLEESIEKVIKSEMCRYLHTKHNLSISIKQLSSVGRFNTISEEDLKKVYEAEEYVNNFLSKVKIYDNIRNATGIYKKVRDFALQIGTYYDVNDKPLTKEEVENVTKGIGNNHKKISHYKKHNDKHYVIILIDHLSLLNPENGETKKQTMDKMSSNYCLHMRDKFGFTPVVVQQFASDKENIENNYKGNTIESKLEPSMNAFGDSKVTVRDANIVLGLFNPSRYGISEHNGYSVSLMRDNYRSLSLLKSRDGIADKKVPLFFNGAADFFKELPKSDDTELMEKVYKTINNLNNK